MKQPIENVNVRKNGMKKDIYDEIARVAHELHEKRGRIPGNELADWLEAEKIVTEKHERHARETEQQVDAIKKPREGFRRTVKKGRFLQERLKYAS